ncbi:hypothetical protein FRZ44_02220 [Hypericibacter terrae]|uniref:DNA recombination protein RmuC homolog n=1 Tax=Hypericibacter terrae TaxID=2602015 RepID=A0A5J6MJQ6_9PROT|nr:DNA recombination protein RmuC [Hypericibacter terrae]QEX14946.1 hypothetical protein FRZ44_02220 [Hypericibacter terrae]
MLDRPFLFESLTILTLFVSFLSIMGIFLVWRRSGDSGGLRGELQAGLGNVAASSERMERTYRSETNLMRDEAEARGKALREEVGGTIRGFSDSIQARVDDLSSRLEERLRSFGAQEVENAIALRDQIGVTLKQVGDDLRKTAALLSQQQEERLIALTSTVDKLNQDSATQSSLFRTSIEERFNAFRKDNAESALAIRTEAATQAVALQEAVAANLNRVGADLRENAKSLVDALQKGLGSVGAQIASLIEANGKQQEALRQVVEGRLDKLREENTNKLEEMRKTVDEKLQGTLEKRLGESFSVVSERLERVHQGLGEMQNLATGVGDLKRVLTNVKVRGGWAEVQLGALLEQMLSPDQYVKNARVKEHSSEVVEYAVRLPGNAEEDGALLLPIDAKFPHEDYDRLVDALERGDVTAVEIAGNQLEARIKAEAKRICDKYIEPPQTTDFAIMFLPTEGLYAEIVRRPGLADYIQRQHRVAISGPTTLTVLLHSFQMGFRTLAIQKRSSEVWRILGEAKAEFGKYGEVIDKVRKQLVTASNSLDDVGVRSRAIERKLRGVEVIEQTSATVALSRDAGLAVSGDVAAD